MTTENTFVIEYPDWYQDDDLEITSKGYLSNLRVHVGDALYEINFYDPRAMAVAVDFGVRSEKGYYFEENIVVVGTLDHAHIEQAVATLASYKFSRLLPSQSLA